MEDRRREPGELELHGFVVGEAGGRIHGTLLDRGTLPEVGVLHDLDVVGCQVGRAEESLEHDPRGPVATRDADFLAFQVCRGGDPRGRLGEDDRRKVPIYRRDVADRDPLADRRDEARTVGQADVHGTLADERHEIRIDLVLEGHVEARIAVVAGLIGQVERRELDARDVAEAHGQGLPDGGGRRRGRRTEVARGGREREDETKDWDGATVHGDSFGTGLVIERARGDAR